MKKRITVLTSLMLTFVLLIVGLFSINYSNSGNSALIRNVKLTNSSLVEDSYFNDFDSYNIFVENNKITFVGLDTIQVSEFYEINEISDSNVDESISLKYTCEFDSFYNIISLSVCYVDTEENVLLDTIYGVVVMNNEKEFDAIFEIDGENVLLSELYEAGQINNVGFWSSLKKVWNSTAGKIGTIVTVAACATVGVICAVVPGGQLVTAAMVGAIVGLVGGAITAGVATYIEEGVVDWEAVLSYAGAGAVVGCVTAVASYKITSAIKSLFPKANPSSNVKGFDSYSAFKKEYGKASDYVNNGEWHHIVEQNTVEKGINSAQSVYNTQNTVAIPKELHVKISGYYSSNYTQGLTVRQYVNTLSYEQQYRFGIEVLTKFASEMGITPFWL